MINAKAAHATANAVNKSQAAQQSSAINAILSMLEGRIKEASKKGFFYIYWTPSPFASDDTIAGVLNRLAECGYTSESRGAWQIKWSDIAE